MRCPGFPRRNFSLNLVVKAQACIYIALTIMCVYYWACNLPQIRLAFIAAIAVAHSGGEL